MSAAPPLMPAPGSLLAQNSLGRTLSATPQATGWQHPWHTSPLWLPQKKAWAATVRAGFVNGTAPRVHTTAGDMRAARGSFYGQIADARSGAAELAQLARLAAGEDEGLPDSAPLDSPLYRLPPVGLGDWRQIGWGGTGRVPLFFQALGVEEPPKKSASEALGGAPTSFPPKGNRLLRACDIWLEQPRAALSSSISIEPAGVVTGGSLVHQTLSLRLPPETALLRLQSGDFSLARAAAALDFQGAGNVMASDYEEKTWDDLLVSTVYLVSPPDAALDAPLDATWSPYVKHALFWNLHWAQPRASKQYFHTDIFRQLTGIVAVLGGGAATGAVNFVAASVNDATQGAANILQAKSLAGHFWSPTGGGTAGASTLASFPSASPASAPQPPGLDKGRNAAARATADAAAKRSLKLDPPFPGEGRPFRRSLLSV